MILAGIQYLLFRPGPVTTTGVESCAFLDPSAPASTKPCKSRLLLNWKPVALPHAGIDGWRYHA